jgi:hypothetical protein
MQTQHKFSNALKLFTCAAVAFAALAHAEEKKPDATGIWTWSVPGRNGGPERTNKLVLKVEGEKVTGTVSSPRRGGEMVETEIKDGKMADGQVSFTVTREFGGNTMTSKYSGKVNSDVIKGKMEFERDGETQSRDWEAKRMMPKAEKMDKMEAPAKTEAK